MICGVHLRVLWNRCRSACDQSWITKFKLKTQNAIIPLRSWLMEHSPLADCFRNEFPSLRVTTTGTLAGFWLNLNIPYIFWGKTISAFPSPPSAKVRLSPFAATRERWVFGSSAFSCFSQMVVMWSLHWQFSIHICLNQDRWYDTAVATVASTWCEYSLVPCNKLRLNGDSGYRHGRIP